MATRKAVFTGTVSMGGRTYEAGEHWVRPQDVRALIDTGAVHWADERPKAAKTHRPGIWAMNETEAVANIASQKTKRRLERWQKEESQNPKGARKGVLNAIKEQIGQLAR